MNNIGHSDRGAGLKFDGGKPQPGLLIEGMPRALARVADVLTFGAKKYKAHSWKQVEDGRERYNDAKIRHQLAAGRGEVYDPESGIEHLAHEACNILFLLELMLEQKEKYEGDIQANRVGDFTARVEQAKQQLVDGSKIKQAADLRVDDRITTYEQYAARVAGFRDPIGYPKSAPEGGCSQAGCICN